MKVVFFNREVELIDTKNPRLKPPEVIYEPVDLVGDFGLAVRTQYGTTTAELEGPWYDDSNPTGAGTNSQEAVADLAAKVMQLRDRLNVLITSCVAPDMPEPAPNPPPGPTAPPRGNQGS